MDSQEKLPLQEAQSQENSCVNNDENTLNTEKTTEIVVNENNNNGEIVEENAGNNQPNCENKTPRVYNSKKEVVERLREIVQNNEELDKNELDTLKVVFYKMHNAEREQALQEYLEKGGDPEKYQEKRDEYEDAFKAEMSVIREKRAEIFRKKEEEKQENLAKKLTIIEKIKAMATSPEEVNKSYNEFKKLQQEWNELKNVPVEKANELWKSYHLYVEQFYDLLKLNIEAREYDFKKNLEIKEKICETAEKLVEETDVISAFHQLQELHSQYKETGPVSKELRETMWQRFKKASTLINKRHQQHFEGLRAHEEENLEKKTKLCEKVEELIKIENNSIADWESRAKEIAEVQAEWKTIGFAPQKMNVKIFERFRNTCNEFFAKRSQFFKEFKSIQSNNADRKRELIAKAKELKDSTDWKETTKKLVEFQKEWKTIGPAPKRVSDQLWSEFRSVCNEFFEARNTLHADIRIEEKENLTKKKEIIQQLKDLLETEEADENVKEKVQELAEQFNQTGHVPFKEKEKIYNEYHKVVDEIYKKLNISLNKRKLDNFKNSLKNYSRRGENALDNERAKLFKRLEQQKQELKQYENNLGFLTISSKKGNSLLDEMKNKMDKLKDEIVLLKEKIRAIDSQEENEENE